MEKVKTLEIQINEGLKDLEILNTIDLDEIEELNIYFWKRLSLRFLKDFKNLKRLMIVGTVKDFSPVSSCSSLDQLYISGGTINTLDFIESLSIRTLLLEKFRSDIEMLTIPNLKTIENISISAVSKIKDLSFLSDFTNLRTLDLFELKTKQLFDFSRLNKFHTLHIFNMFHLKNFLELSTLTRLDLLEISYFFLNKKMKIDAKSELLKVIDQLSNVKTVRLSINHEITEREQLLSRK